MWSGKHLELAGYGFGRYVGERIVVWLMRGGAGWVGGWWRGLVMEGVAFEDDGRNNEKMPGFFFFSFCPLDSFSGALTFTVCVESTMAAGEIRNGPEG